MIIVFVPLTYVYHDTSFRKRNVCANFIHFFLCQISC